MDKDVIQFITDQNKDLRDYLRDDMTELIKFQATAVSARVDAKIEQKMGSMEKKIDSIVSHNKRQNGWITKHAERLEELEVHSEECRSYRKMSDKIFKNWKVWVIALIAILFFLNVIFDQINFQTLISWVADKIF